MVIHRVFYPLAGNKKQDLDEIGLVLGLDDESLLSDLNEKMRAELGSPSPMGRNNIPFRS